MQFPVWYVPHWDRTHGKESNVSNSIAFGNIFPIESTDAPHMLNGMKTSRQKVQIRLSCFVDGKANITALRILSSSKHNVSNVYVFIL